MCSSDLGSAGIVNPIPSITSLSPTSATAGSASLSLTIGGNYLLSNSVVTFNGIPHSASLTSSGNLTITLTASDLTTPGTFSIVVTNPVPGGGASNAVNFTVQPSVSQNPVPSISNLSPSSATAGSGPLTVAINGTGFLATSTVTFNGTAHPATFVTANQLTISLSSADLGTAGTFSVVVTNPAPGGGSSNAVNLVVTSGIPAAYTISTVAGNGTSGSSGDGGQATKSPLLYPISVAVDGSGNLYISDGPRVRKVAPSGIITTVAGGGNGCTQQTDSLGDGCPAVSAVLSAVQGLALDATGNLYISEDGVRIRLVSRSGIITTVAGSINGVMGYGGDNGPATSALMNYAAGIALDSSGNLYIADEENNRIRKVSASG